MHLGKIKRTSHIAWLQQILKNTNNCKCSSQNKMHIHSLGTWYTRNMLRLTYALSNTYKISERETTLHPLTSLQTKRKKTVKDSDNVLSGLLRVQWYEVVYQPGDYFKHARSLSVIIMLKLTVVVTKFGKQAFTIQGGNNRW